MAIEERKVPGCPGLTARTDGTIWFDGEQLFGWFNSLGYLCVTVGERPMHFAEVLRRAFSPVRGRTKDIPPEEQARMREQALTHSIRDVADAHGVAYMTAWRICNKGV